MKLTCVKFRCVASSAKDKGDEGEGEYGKEEDKKKFSELVSEEEEEEEEILGR